MKKYVNVGNICFVYFVVNIFTRFDIDKKYSNKIERNKNETSKLNKIEKSRNKYLNLFTVSANNTFNDFLYNNQFYICFVLGGFLEGSAEHTYDEMVFGKNGTSNVIFRRVIFWHSVLK